MLKKILQALGMSKKMPRTGKPIGEVTHYFGDISVAIVKFKQEVPVGAILAFQGHTTDFSQSVSSMQYDHKPVQSAPKGREVGIKVKDKVRVGDMVFLDE